MNLWDGGCKPTEFCLRVEAGRCDGKPPPMLDADVLKGSNGCFISIGATIEVLVIDKHRLFRGYIMDLRVCINFDVGFSCEKVGIDFAGADPVAAVCSATGEGSVATACCGLHCFGLTPLES